MVGDGPRADYELIGDLAVGLAGGHQTKHLDLSATQSIRVGGLGRRPGVELLSDRVYFLVEWLHAEV